MSDDRTAEFMSLARSLPQDRLQANPASITSQGGSIVSATDTAAYTGRYGRAPYSNGSGAAAAAANNPAYQELRNFHNTASGISRDIAATSHMLTELTRFVKNKSLFVDDSQQVNSLVHRIKSNIENLNGRLDDANQTIQYQKRRLGRNSQAGQEALNLVGQLQEEFVQATAGFKRVLQERTDNMKETTDQKRRVYGGNVDSVSLDNRPPVYGQAPPATANTTTTTMTSPSFPTLDLTSGMSAGEPTGSSLPRPHGAIGDGGGSALYSTPELRLRRGADPYGSAGGGGMIMSGTPLTPLDIQRMEQESGAQQQMQLIPDQTYLLERADAMATVESNIVELGTIFNKLAVMVHEHGDLVQRVEDNVDEANTNISLSLDTLTDTLTNLRTNKALFYKLLGVITFFIILFVVAFA